LNKTKAMPKEMKNKLFSFIMNRLKGLG